MSCDLNCLVARFVVFLSDCSALRVLLFLFRFVLLFVAALEDSTSTVALMEVITPDFALTPKLKVECVIKLKDKQSIINWQFCAVQ